MIPWYVVDYMVCGDAGNYMEWYASSPDKGIAEQWAKALQDKGIHTTISVIYARSEY